MPVSPCAACSTETPHTEDDELPLCDPCGQAAAYYRVIQDMLSGEFRPERTNLNPEGTVWLDAEGEFHLEEA